MRSLRRHGVGGDGVGRAGKGRAAVRRGRARPTLRPSFTECGIRAPRAIFFKRAFSANTDCQSVGTGNRELSAGFIALSRISRKLGTAAAAPSSLCAFDNEGS